MVSAFISIRLIRVYKRLMLASVVVDIRNPRSGIILEELDSKKYRRLVDGHSQGDNRNNVLEF